MGMPNDLIAVRHGQSEGNVVTDAVKAGDLSLHTEEIATTPGRLWRLTDRGRAQAALAGSWIADEIGAFDRHYVSPYIRTRETAAHLALPDAAWRPNRAMRERDWGDIGSMPRTEFETRPEYRENAWLKEHDPLYWVAPNGESIAHVAEDRVRNVLSTLHRECDSQRVICVAHGEWMWALRLVLERMSDETFGTLDADPLHKIHNCTVLHYTRLDPDTGRQAPRLTWLRRAVPDVERGVMVVEDWTEITFATFTNDELLAQADAVPLLFPGR